MRKASVFILFLLLACSKDAPVPEEPATVNYTVAVSASDGGVVNSTGGSYAQNTTITLTATAADGFVFSGWSGDVTGTTNPLSYSVTANASIVANFTRSSYSFNLQTSGQGSVAEELVSSAKSKTDYESGSTVRLTATPEAGWLFYRWEGLARGFIDAATGQEEVSVDFDNPIEVEVNSSINATGTFEQIISEDDNPTSGVGKWKIRKKSVSSKSNKSLLVDCDITEIIFRTDATFSIFTSTATISGQYVFDSNTSISLSQSNSPFGTITNIVISNSFISFSIDINNGCNDDLDGDKDDDYIESEDPITGTVASATCSITSSLDSGSETQTVTQTSSIQDIVYSFTTTCTETLSASADNLPPGVTMTFNNNQVTISGAPSDNASGTYDYTIVVTAPNIATSVSGQISVLAATTTSTSSTACSISGTLTSGQASQTLTFGQAINAIAYEINSDCQVLSAQAYNLPSGITMGTNFQEASNSNTINISGTPTSSASGTYNYDIVVSEASTTNSITLSGIITVLSATSTSTTSSSTADTAPPVITLLGSSTINLTVGDTFTDPGATATDDVDGDLTSSITTETLTNITPPFVDTSRTGTYTIAYSVSDAAGNAATVVERTVIVNAAVSNSGNIYFENGTCKCPNATVGETADINGVTYTAVDNSSISVQIANGNVNLCTTLVTSMADLFQDNTSFNSDIGFWDVSRVTNMSYMFFNASSFNQNISNWNISNAGYIDNLFNGATAFNQDIGGWNTSNVIGMSGVFDSAENFNQDISNWNTSSVNNMESLFFGAFLFNQDISGWDVSGVTDMSNMFRAARAFNQNIGNWDTSNVINMTEMFRNADEFNQNINTWNVSTVTNMSGMFRGTALFNQSLSNWDVSSVTVMDDMFNTALAFNQDIGNWDTSNVTSMGSMFVSTNSTPNIGGWDVSNVTNMGGMFLNANNFNDDIGSWDTSNATNMSSMFRDAGLFNQNIGNWDTSSVTDMELMFRGAPNFNQDLKGWCVSNITSEPELFTNDASALTEANKPLWGKEFTLALTSGTNSQTVTGTTAITDIKYTATPICASSISASASGLPSGVTLAFGNNVATLSGTPNETGTFNFTLTVSGASTSQAVTGTITVNAGATADTTPPVISLLGSSTINLTVGDTFTDPGVTANDDVDGDITLSITASGIVDTSTAGTYVITYSISDTAGNTTTVDRTIIVSAAASSYSISVTASSNADYTLSGTDANGTVSGNDVSITINAGETLNFNVDASSHPFYIKTAQGSGTDNQASGVSNNGATNGTVTWTPTTAGTYYYQCSAHNGMYGTIIVQ